MIKDRVIKTLIKKLGDHFILLTPKDPSFGDFALNFNSLVGTGRDLSDVSHFHDPALFDRVEKKGTFINFFIKKEVLLQELKTIIQKKEKYGRTDARKKEKIIVEFAHPNTHKLFHIGHLRNIILGEALSRLMETKGYDIIRANYQGDVGLHIAKCLFIVKSLPRAQSRGLKTVQQRISFLGEAYAQGNKAYESDEKAKAEIQKINQQIFERDVNITPLWNETRGWSLEYFDYVYKRLRTEFDRLYFESEVTDRGRKIAQEALVKGILKKSEGAVIFDGKPYSLDTRVFINSKNLPTYEAKELGLAEREFSEWGTIDRCIHVVGPEQASFFKVLFKVQDLLDEKKYKGKQFHYIYGFVRLKTGKMSSREGTVVEGMWLIDETKKKISDTFHTDSTKSELLAMAAVKYAFLKIDAKKDFTFDIHESVSLSGNSGVYVEYAYARCLSILRKAKELKQEISQTKVVDFAPEEYALMRELCRFPEVVDTASSHYSPHLITTYLFNLCQQFNLFYERQPILKADKSLVYFRLKLTTATSQIIKNALHLLGIETVEKV